ncbi:plexin-C1 isoform X3 [Phycodurus eques]|uniref:plexin-C1 isoform X3 n=1 Tax=Phycodurus eques TaxID=693459 RepID=UPI002ACDA3E7|nr:plexin-C1 isoform X3 [Phycodurus eques]
MLPPRLWASVLCLLWAEGCRCLEATGGSFTADGAVRHLVTALDGVYVATEEKLYQLRRDLSVVRAVNQRGVLTGAGDAAQFSRVAEEDPGNATFGVNVLLAFAENGTLVSCGVTDDECGYCELRALADVSAVLHRERILVGPPGRSGASAAVLVAVDGVERDFYILTAVRQRKGESSRGVCASSTEAVYLHDTDNRHDGGIFSFSGDSSNPLFKSRGDVDFVDAFQLGSAIYLLANVLPSEAGGGRVRLIWLRAKTKKADTLKSLRGASLLVPGQKGGRLAASSVVSAGPASTLWAGVFGADGDPSATQLLLFDVTPDPEIPADKDPDFCSAVTCGRRDGAAKELQPLKVLYRRSAMTSVAATTHGTWMVFFVGTEDGQLIKLSVDQNHRGTCPTVLYRSADDRKAFPGMRLDRADGKHVYAAFDDQVLRVPASTCRTRRTREDCWSAQDPSCVWCHSKKSCTFKDECQNSHWFSFPDDYQKKRISYTVQRHNSGQIRLDVRTHVSADQNARDTFACQFSRRSGELCSREGPFPTFPQCTCVLLNGTLSAEGTSAAVKVRLGPTVFTERIKLTTCSDIRGSPTAALCRRCVETGCGWSEDGCSWATAGATNDGVCETTTTRPTNVSKPEIYSISPGAVSFYGHNRAVLLGSNLGHVTGVRIQIDEDCAPRESPVWNNTGVSLEFHIPAIRGKGTVRACAVLPDGGCHGDAAIAYTSAPSCAAVTPSSTWSSGKRTITLAGSNLDAVDGVSHGHALQEVSLPADRSFRNLTYQTPAAASTRSVFSSDIYLKVANETLACWQSIAYHPDPQFTGFTATRRGDDVRVAVQKSADRLEMTVKEVSASGVYGGEEYPCVTEAKDAGDSADFFVCKIRSAPDVNFRQLKVFYGDKTVTLRNTSHPFALMWLVVLAIPCIVVAVALIYRRQQKQLTVKMNKRMENLELDIRNDIRQGFVDMQTEKANLLEKVGPIPFLDYKDFACRIFFPENEALTASCTAEARGRPKESVPALSELIRDRRFLTCAVHAAEEQKSFTVKDKCAMASLLTVALHGDLSYLTETTEELLKDLMRKNSTAQAKMLLRRTESVVEKLLTNWMSICLYGFLKESVGQHLFLLASALTQQIARGPVDRVTGKALYTLSEDWLLWQAQDFTSLRLKALFAAGGGGEVSEPLEAVALTCDTVEQAKEKILRTFEAKFGFPYNRPPMSVSIELERDGAFVALEEVDASSEAVGEVTMLNTLEHYKVPDGATIKVLSRKDPSASWKGEPTGGTSPDSARSQTAAARDGLGSHIYNGDTSGKYFHLIDPDVDENRGKNPERKKLKLKEVHLTKLLSTKVAVHSFVENLFGSVWGPSNRRAPLAVKYFFDFLDRQADEMKISDPDVLHIWKTNSFPLRFWVNILKNPQFVFDLDKSAHLDGCLSVTAQAFMDSFSLSDTQLGKHAPTNKLLYAKDVPKYKEEAKDYFRRIREQQPISRSDFYKFLDEESKKHQNDFNEAAALEELGRMIRRYVPQICEKLEQTGAPAQLREQLRRVQETSDGARKSRGAAADAF